MELTPEMIEALVKLRETYRALEESGIFALIEGVAPEEPVAERAPAPYVQPAGLTSCDHCHGEYKTTKSGVLRLHNCWSYDTTAKTVVYGDRDIRKRHLADGPGCTCKGERTDMGAHLRLCPTWGSSKIEEFWS